MSLFDQSSQLFAEFPPVSLEEWRSTIKRDLKGRDPAKYLKRKPAGEFGISAFYRQEDLEELDHLKTRPGDFPYVRGGTPTGNQWCIREAIYDREPDQANEEARGAIERGVDMLSFSMKVFPSQGMLGGDLEGTTVQSQDDFSRLLTGIDMESTSLYFDTGMASPAYLSMLSNEIENRNVEEQELNACFLYDPCTYSASYGRWPSTVNQFMHYADQMVQFSVKHLPGVRPLSVNLLPYHYGGASNVQELGIALALGQEYMAHLTDRSCRPAEVMSHIHLAVPIGSSYFMNIAKLRALRLLWSRFLEAYLPDEEEPEKATIHATTSQWSHTLYDAHTNMVRNTSQSMSAVIGGCESLMVTPHDAAYKVPGDFSRRMARNNHHIMREESHLEKVADPAGGAYYIEKLTDELARHAWKFFQEMEKQGGFLKAVEGGFLQSAVNQVRKQRQQEFAEGRSTMVGINDYPDPEQQMASSLKKRYGASSLAISDHDPAISAERPLNSIAEAFNDGALVGDVINSWVSPGRQYLQTIHPTRMAYPFENLRLQTEKYEKRSGHRPQVLLIPMGAPARRQQRANFAANLLGCAGYDLEKPLGFESFDEARERIKHMNPDLVVLCAPDDQYLQMVNEIAPFLQQLSPPPRLSVAGYPDEHEKMSEKGVDYFMHSFSNRLELLTSLQRDLGVQAERRTETV